MKLKIYIDQEKKRKLSSDATGNIQTEMNCGGVGQGGVEYGGVGQRVEWWCRVGWCRVGRCRVGWGKVAQVITILDHYQNSN